MMFIFQPADYAFFFFFVIFAAISFIIELSVSLFFAI